MLEHQKIGYVEPKLKGVEQYCDKCDGCGWYEGGETMVTVCEDCEGTGIFPTRK